MENNWPETIDELMEECQMLVSKTDLYELGERGEPFTGESEPRIDGTDYLAGEYQYGVAMIPAQWVTHVLGNATLGNGECENVAPDYLDFLCSDCGFVHYHSDENDTGDGNDWAYCPRCGKAVKR